MLVELAIGDAYGAGFEYTDAKVVRRENTLAGYFQHPRHLSIAPGCYTDDTQMTLAVAEALLSGQPWTPQLLADHFVRAFKRDPREGYAGRFYDFLCEIRDGEEFLAKIIPHSDKSGAAMRAAPLGVLPELREVVERTTLQARLTHDTADGINAAVAAALAVHYCLYHLGPCRALGQFIEAHVPGEWNAEWKGKVGAQGWMSTRAALTALMRNHSLSDLLRDCIAFTGDVDTVATIALAAASCSTEYQQDLPEHLVRQLENGPFGRDYLADLDRRLMALRDPVQP